MHKEHKQRKQSLVNSLWHSTERWPESLGSFLAFSIFMMVLQEGSPVLQSRIKPYMVFRHRCLPASDRTVLETARTGSCWWALAFATEYLFYQMIMWSTRAVNEMWECSYGTESCVWKYLFPPKGICNIVPGGAALEAVSQALKQAVLRSCCKAC